MKKIFILGSGGFAKEVYWLLKDINQVSKDAYNIMGFIDIIELNNSVQIGEDVVKIFTEDEFLDNYSLNGGACLALGIGDPSLLKKLSDKLGNKFDFPNLIHPSFLGNQADIKLGEGNIIAAGCIFTTSINIDSFNVFNLNVTVGHDSKFGSCNVINPGSNISGDVQIGDMNLIGTNATILQNLKITSNVILGAGSLLTKPIIESGVYVGSPTKKIK